MKLTDEQLSRVLTAHVRGGLKTRSCLPAPGYPACLFQVALDAGALYDVMNYDCTPITDDIEWFDKHYQADWSVDMFLCKLEIRGLA